MAKIIGLTGGIASGKSTVAHILKTRGFAIIDADLAARVVVEPGEEAYKKVVEAFGEEILLPNRTIDRAKLGSIIFRNQDKREQLNKIVHPAVRERMDKWKETAVQSGKNTIIYDIPLLYESKLTHLVEKVMVVYVDKDIQLQRLMARNHLTRQEAKIRMDSQMPLHEKKKLADVVINNNGSMSETEAQVDAIIANWNLVP